MSEPDKKGSTWPWIVVPIAAISLFFALRYCQRNLPPAAQAESPAVIVPAPAETPAPAAPNAEPSAETGPAPEPQ